MAAAASRVHPAPTSPPPPGRVVAPRRLAAAAVDAVICLFLASMWLFLWAQAAWNVGRLACGESCPVAIAAAAEKVIIVAGLTFALLLCFGLLPLVGWQVRAVGVDIDLEAAKAPPARKSFSVVVREELRDPVMIGTLVLLAFALLLGVGGLLKGDSPVNGSRRERIGSVIYDVGGLGMTAVNCLLICPVLTVRIWRAFRMA